MLSYVLYFIPGLQAATLQALKASVLSDVVSDLHSDDDVASQVIRSGPDGSPGVLFCVPPEGKLPDDFGFFFDRQTWHSVPDGVWIGWNDAAVIQPEHLLRRSCPVPELDCEWVLFADGSQWLIPRLRDPMLDHPDGPILLDDPQLHSTALKTAHFRDA